MLAHTRGQLDKIAPAVAHPLSQSPPSGFGWRLQRRRWRFRQVADRIPAPARCAVWPHASADIQQRPLPVLGLSASVSMRVVREAPSGGSR
jgi:hypothetical protein